MASHTSVEPDLLPVRPAQDHRQIEEHLATTGSLTRAAVDNTAPAGTWLKLNKRDRISLALAGTQQQFGGDAVRRFAEEAMSPVD